MYLNDIYSGQTHAFIFKKCNTSFSLHCVLLETSFKESNSS